MAFRKRTSLMYHSGQSLFTYNCAKHLAQLLRPLVGSTVHHVKNAHQFSELIRHVRVEEDEVLCSYDVSALFTSVPVDKALIIIKERLEEDKTMADRTNLSPSDIISLLELCLKCTYFVFRGELYLQDHGAAMWSPVSPIVCNIYMEFGEFEKKVLMTASYPPEWWFRYTDDTHTKQKARHVEEFTHHLISIDQDIQFTTEKEENC